MYKILLDIAPIPDGTMSILSTPAKIAFAAGIVCLLLLCAFFIRNINKNKKNR